MYHCYERREDSLNYHHSHGMVTPLTTQNGRVSCVYFLERCLFFLMCWMAGRNHHYYVNLPFFVRRVPTKNYGWVAAGSATGRTPRRNIRDVILQGGVGKVKFEGQGPRRTGFHSSLLLAILVFQICWTHQQGQLFTINSGTKPRM